MCCWTFFLDIFSTLKFVPNGNLQNDKKPKLYDEIMVPC